MRNITVNNWNWMIFLRKFIKFRIPRKDKVSIFPKFYWKCDTTFYLFSIFLILHYFINCLYVYVNNWDPLVYHREILLVNVGVREWQWSKYRMINKFSSLWIRNEMTQILTIYSPISSPIHTSKYRHPYKILFINISSFNKRQAEIIEYIILEYLLRFLPS